ncbi:MAG: hypothetical protein Q8Q09_07600 [Deltaproteobacteria bacterium]|nr:hypothetical protein [Deltaproteobacteria bacterium]
MRLLDGHTLVATHVLFWFGHRPQCPQRTHVPSYRAEQALVCQACMPEVCPTCPLCGTPAKRVGESEGYAHYAFHALCPTCVSTVRGAGVAPIRREKSTQARADLLCETFATLKVTETARRRIRLEGHVGGREVRLILKHGAREGQSERFVYAVALDRVTEVTTVAELAGDPALWARLDVVSLSVFSDGRTWLRVALRHLGRTDAVRLLEAMVQSADALSAQR